MSDYINGNHSSDDEPNEFDWNRAEAELSGGPGSADVVDLDAARRDRNPDPDVDLDDDEAGPVMVDSPEAQRSSRFSFKAFADGQRRPIVPGWLKSKQDFFSQVARAGGLAGHTAAYHGLRSPLYVGKIVIRVPVGGARLARVIGRWVFDLEGEPVRLAVVRREDAEQYLKLTKVRDRRVRWRGLVAALGAVVVPTVGLLLAYGPVPAWLPWLTAGVTVAGLGLFGRQADKPLLDTAVVRSEYRPLTSNQVVEALASLGIGRINQALARDPRAIRFPAPIRTDGPGYRADVILPPGVTADMIVERRKELASGLGRPLGCVWPAGNSDEHPGHLVLYVADRDMSKSKQAAWPLLKAGRVDLFKAFPFGTDARSREVGLTLMFASMVIGSIPRMGKTFAARLILLAAALDVRAELHVYDLKGTGDFSALEPVAHRYRAGDEDEDIDYALAAMRELRTELRRRTKVIRELPRDICPESKVTPELADKKSLGLHPVVVGVDECQVWFEHPKHGAEFEEIATDLVKRGPAVGMIPLFATQRPDAKSLPTAISANAVLRFCLKVMGHMENDMVLGTGMHKAGIKATTFSRKDRGIGYLVGEGDDPQISKSYYVDNPAAEKVVARARAMREKAGRITGYALGQAHDAQPGPAYDLLTDVLAVVPASEAKVWSETIATRLVELRPDTYGGWSGEHVSTALKALGVPTGRQVWGTDPATGKGANRKGIHRDDITRAITERDGKGKAS